MAGFEITPNEAMMARIGKYGADYINNTTIKAGPYWMLQATEATTLSSTTLIGGTAAGEQITLADTQVVIGDFTNVRLASGAVIAVYAIRTS